MAKKTTKFHDCNVSLRENVFILSQIETFIFTFIQSRVLVRIDHTYFCILAIWFYQSFYIVKDSRKEFSLIPEWNIVPKMEQSFHLK